VDVHKTLFGVENDVMVNTYKEGASNLNSAAKHCEYGANGYNTMPSKIVITRSALLTGPNGEINIKYIPIAARTSGNVAVELTSISATDAPLKFMAPLGTPWAAERVKFGDAYTGFAEWVGDRNKTPWSTGQSSLVCNIESVPPTDAEIKAPVIDTNGNGVVVTGNTPTTPTTPNVPTVTHPDNPTYNGPDVTFTSEWSGNISLNKNTYPAVGNVGNGTVVRVYGYGTSSDWHVKLARQETNWVDIDWITGSTSYTFTKPLTFTLNAEQATNLKNSGTLIVYGKDYVVKYVDIDNSGVTNDEVEEDDEEENNDDDNSDISSATTVWSATSYTNQGEISATVLKEAGLQKNKKAYLVVTGTRGTDWWYVKPMINYDKIINASQSENSSCGHWEDSNLANTSAGYVEIELDASSVNGILDNCLRVEYGNINIISIELKQ
jgi:hypothetical protein